MARRPQKPFHMLQDQRKSRRRPQLVVNADDYPPMEAPTPRERALDMAIGQLERSFGRGAIPKASRPEQEQSAKAKVAAGKPRDAKGHFIKRTQNGGAIPEALAGVTGTEEELLAALTRAPPVARRPRLLELAAELGDEALDQVIAALVALRVGRRDEG